jgi:hypothetical protein
MRNNVNKILFASARVDAMSALRSADAQTRGDAHEILRQPE